MFKQVLSYQTLDGVIHDSEEHAKQYVENKIGKVIETIVKGEINKLTPFKVTSAIYENRKALYEVLRLEFDNSFMDYD